MYPTLFQIGSFKVHSYGVMLLVAFFVALWIAKRRAPKHGLDPNQVSDAALWTLLVGILGARIVFILLELPSYLREPEKLWSWQFQGLTSFGGLLGGFLFLLFWAKRKGKSPVAVFDTFAGPMFIGFVIGRVGCLLNGCCFGPACGVDSSFCIPVEGLPGLYQPAQIYDSLFNLASYFVLVFLERRGVALGQSLSLFLILHGASRFAYEFWRAGTSSEVLGPIPLTLAQLTALAMIVVGSALFIWYGRRARLHPPEVPAS